MKVPYTIGNRNLVALKIHEVGIEYREYPQAKNWIVNEDDSEGIQDWLGMATHCEEVTIEEFLAAIKAPVRLKFCEIKDID